MPDDTLWEALRDRCDAIEPGTELLTPLSDRPFRVLDADHDRARVRFDDSGEERDRWRDQFAILADRIDELEGEAGAQFQSALRDLEDGLDEALMA